MERTTDCAIRGYRRSGVIEIGLLRERLQKIDRAVRERLQGLIFAETGIDIKYASEGFEIVQTREIRFRLISLSLVR